MNGLLIATGILFLVCVVVGFARGFIKIVASLAATIAILVLVVTLTPYVSTGIREIIPIESVIKEKCMKELPVEEEIPREKQIEVIEGADIPELFRELLLENNNNEAYQALGVTTFMEYVGGYLAKIVADIVGFLLTLLVTTALVRSVVYALGWIGNLPVIGGFNRIAGGVLGLGIGLVIIWIVFIVITLLYRTDIGKICFENIGDSQLLTFLYEENILMNYIMKF